MGKFMWSGKAGLAVFALAMTNNARELMWAWTRRCNVRFQAGNMDISCGETSAILRGINGFHEVCYRR